MTAFNELENFYAAVFEAQKLSSQSFTYPGLSTRTALPDKKNPTDQAWGHSFCNGYTDLRTENEERRKEEESLPILSQFSTLFLKRDSDTCEGG